MKSIETEKRTGSKEAYDVTLSACMQNGYSGAMLARAVAVVSSRSGQQLQWSAVTVAMVSSRDGQLSHLSTVAMVRSRSGKQSQWSAVAVVSSPLAAAMRMVAAANVAVTNAVSMAAAIEVSMVVAITVSMVVPQIVTMPVTVSTVARRGVK